MERKSLCFSRSVLLQFLCLVIAFLIIFSSTFIAADARELGEITYVGDGSGSITFNGGATYLGESYDVDYEYWREEMANPDQFYSNGSVVSGFFSGSATRRLPLTIWNNDKSITIQHPVTFQYFTFNIKLDVEATGQESNTYLASRITPTCVYIIHHGEKYYGSISKQADDGSYMVSIAFKTDSGLNTTTFSNFSHSIVVEYDFTAYMYYNVTADIPKRLDVVTFTPEVNLSSSADYNFYYRVVEETSNGDLLEEAKDQNSELDKQTSQLKEQNAELDKQTEELEAQTETQKGILKKVTDFFGSFFDNLKDSVVGLFVPSGEELSDLITSALDDISERFGLLIYPFEVLVRFVDIVVSTEGSTQIVFPGFELMGHTVWYDYIFDFNDYPIVSDIFGYCRIGTSVIIVFSFLDYVRKVFDKFFGGGS